MGVSRSSRASDAADGTFEIQAPPSATVVVPARPGLVARLGTKLALEGMKALLGHADKNGKNQDDTAPPAKSADVTNGTAVTTQITTTKPAGPGPAAPPTDETKKTVRSFQHLPADDCGGDFEPNWLPSILAEGAGLDQLVNFDSAQTAMLNTLPSIDDHSLAASAGFIPAFADVAAGQQRPVNYAASGEPLELVDVDPTSPSSPRRLVIADQEHPMIDPYEPVVPGMWYEAHLPGLDFRPRRIDRPPKFPRKLRSMLPSTRSASALWR